MNFNSILKQHCELNGISQNELAERLGITQSAVSKYFKNQIPNFEIGLRICKNLGLNPELFTNETVRDIETNYNQLKSLKLKWSQLSANEKLEFYLFVKKDFDENL